MPRFLFVVLLTVLAGCADPAPPAPDGTLPADAPVAEPDTSRARQLVDAAIAAHGGAVMRHAEMQFLFRGTPFRLVRDGDQFRYARLVADSLGRVMEEVVDNDGTHRFIDGADVALDDRERLRVETAVNSVAYFALLPLPLTDPAVRLRELPPDTIRGQPYDRIEVTFAQDGGGRDYEDRYLYWLHPETHVIDYLAYSYELGATETGPNATGSRFREVIGVTESNTVRVQDYRNLTADVGEDLERYAALYQDGLLRVVSDVVLDSVRVTPLSP